MPNEIKKKKQTVFVHIVEVITVCVFVLLQQACLFFSPFHQLKARSNGCPAFVQQKLYGCGANVG